MIDVVGFALGAAQQILAAVLTEALNDQRAKKREIEREARERAGTQPGLSKADMDALTSRIMSELRNLVDQHPDLEWQRNGVRVILPIPADTAGMSDVTNALLRERLERLNRLARTRWEQVRIESVVPDTSSALFSPTPNPTPNPASTRPPETTPGGAEIIAVRDYDVEPASYWRQRIERMRANVRAEQRRRPGDDRSGAGAGELREGGATAPLPESPPSA